MTEFFCPVCDRPYKTKSGFLNHVTQKHSWTKEQCEQWMLSMVEPGPEEVTGDGNAPEGLDSLSEPSTASDSTVMLEGNPSGLVPATTEAEMPVLEGAGSLPPADTSDEEHEELVRDIMANRLTAPLFTMLRELYGFKAEIEAFRDDVIKAVADIDEDIKYLKAVPTGEPDLIAGFDRFVEKYGLGDTITDTIRRIPDILERAVGGDPVEGQLGPEFLKRAKALYLTEQETKGRLLVQLEDALAEGKTPYFLSPEDVERARAEGFIEDESGF